MPKIQMRASSGTCEMSRRAISYSRYRLIFTITKTEETSMRSIGESAASCLFVLMFAVQVNAQRVERTPSAETYGTAATTYLTLQATEFRPLDSTMTYTMTTAPWGFYRSNSGGLGWFGAPVHLPEGASLTSFEVKGCDFDVMAQINFYL